MGELQKLFLGEKLTVRVLPGRGGKPIGRLQDGRVILFDQDNPYWSILAPGQSVECHVKVMSENYIIVDPISEPEAAVIVHYPEEEDFPDIDMKPIIKDLEKMIKKVKGKNAEIVPRALLRIIQLEQLIIKILKRG
ncbi:unnamed protein product [marine sediment metagenome]|uniref:TRAM domain-containing protein n=1 Tax=marine sediment metagenome TaxID=412755 RepID=X1IMS5_9ZZZZ